MTDLTASKKSRLILLLWISTFFSLPNLVSAQLLSKEEIDYVIKDAKAGNVESQFNLSVLYGSSTFGMKDLEASREWLKKSAEGGFLNAINNYRDVLLDEGKEDEALKFAKLAASKGGDLERRRLGDFYLKAIGTSKDLNQAIKWYKSSGREGLRALTAVDLEKYGSEDHRWIHFVDDTRGNSFYYVPQSVYQVDEEFKVLIKKVHSAPKTEKLYNNQRDRARAKMGANIKPTTMTFDQEIRAYFFDCSEREWEIYRSNFIRGSTVVFQQGRTMEETTLSSDSILQDLVKKYCK